ncbi:MATE family efflux transporter [Neobacillus muris]|uniref:MATE family efflux transporter n=1 Tax=Neobacillus muris TaxID=2941334 RepID=UPI00204213BA|nr:MATE family efflux transporter [Neobacillus muris]
MNQTFTIREKTKQIIILIIPILITQLGMFSMIFFNTVMSGKYHSTDLAGVAIGSSLWSPIFTGLSSILLAVSPIAAQYLGQRKTNEISSVVRHGLYLSVILTLIILVSGFFLLKPILEKMNLERDVAETAFHYLIGLSFGILPLFLFNVLRSFIYGLGKTRVVMMIMISSLPFNLLLNYCFIFGRLGLPELGGAGAGYAVAITYWLILAFTVFIVKTQVPFNQYHVFSNLKHVSLERLKEILKIGIPMGLSTFFETSMFAVVTILISTFSVTTVASYQSALNIVSFLYMIPTSISMAVTVLVGYEAGAMRYKDAQSYSWLGIGLAVLTAIITGVLVVVFRYQVAGLYSNERAVIDLTAHFLIFSLFFQMSDAIQVTAQAALRGYKDVNAAFMMTLAAYWVICLPAGYLLAHYTSLGVRGYWIGLTIGLLAAGIALSSRLIYIQKRIYSSSPGN